MREARTLLRRRHRSQMAAAGGGRRGMRLGGALWRARRLTHRFGKRHQIVSRGRGRLELTVEADKLPAPGRGQAAGMRLAQIICMWLGVDGQRTDYGGGIRIDIGQRGDRLPGTAIAGTTPWRPHGVTLSDVTDNRLIGVGDTPMQDHALDWRSDESSPPPPLILASPPRPARPGDAGTARARERATGAHQGGDL